MASCLVESMATAAGKSTICAGLGRKLIDKGTKVGYFKPLLLATEPKEPVLDKDCEFFKNALRIEGPAGSLCPVAMTQQALEAARSGGVADIRHKLNHVHADFVAAAKGKQEMLIEGLGNVSRESPQALLSQALAETLDAKVLLVARYAQDLTASQIAATAKLYGARALGVVVNMVPAGRAALVQSSLIPALKQAGVDVFGVIPESRTLFAITVADIAEQLSGQILNNPDRADALVENVMVGAMGIDPAVGYFSLKSAKAVVTRSNRADIQLAALETPTSCLVLTGGSKPIQNIQFRAEEKQVPMVLVKEDTLSTLARLEAAFGKGRLQQEQKLDALDDLMTQSFDVKAFSGKMGIKP